MKEHVVQDRDRHIAFALLSPLALMTLLTIRLRINAAEGGAEPAATAAGAAVAGAQAALFTTGALWGLWRLLRAGLVHLRGGPFVASVLLYIALIVLSTTLVASWIPAPSSVSSAAPYTDGLVRILWIIVLLMGCLVPTTVVALVYRRRLSVR